MRSGEVVKTLVRYRVGSDFLLSLGAKLDDKEVTTSDDDDSDNDDGVSTFVFGFRGEERGRVLVSRDGFLLSSQGFLCDERGIPFLFCSPARC